MYSRESRRTTAAPAPRRGRRVLAALVVLVVIGGITAVTQVSNAGVRTRNRVEACQPNASNGGQTPQAQQQQQQQRRFPFLRNRRSQQPCAPTGGNNNTGGNNTGGNNTGNNTGGNNTGGNDNGGNNNGGGQVPGPADNNGLDVIGRDCSDSRLQGHDGFQNAPRCVSTAGGEVAAEDRSPSLLITEAPGRVQVNEGFTIRVSTRNLVRDRFLGAAAGGYYLEASFLNDQGLQRGHFHTACRMLENTDEAPDAAPVPAFFKATEDGGGGQQPDSVDVQVTGLPNEGLAQCAVWAGDGSHRTPMMQRANQTPAFDVVRIEVTN
ncbi:MAG TPA: Pecanex-like protein 1 [Pilimelia sp.]|nr:Pecanex-like protein 1 [Pilimelia sp.]